MKINNIFVEGSQKPWEKVGDGVQRKILGYDTELMMVHVEFKKGSIGTMHVHPHTQVTYVEAGMFEVRIDGSMTILSSGDCFFVPPNAEHGVVALQDGVLVDVFTPARKDFLK
jgi:quercetin dioxygenase-like cupin family protein